MGTPPLQRQFLDTCYYGGGSFIDATEGGCSQAAWQFSRFYLTKVDFDVMG